VECITRQEERMIEEAPAAYKAIEAVVRVQADVGIARPVARMRPLLTFKA
jgi:tRNA-splicing ligase RtcB